MYGSQGTGAGWASTVRSFLPKAKRHRLMSSALLTTSPGTTCRTEGRWLSWPWITAAHNLAKWRVVTPFQSMIRIAR